MMLVQEKCSCGLLKEIRKTALGNYQRCIICDNLWLRFMAAALKGRE